MTQAVLVEGRHRVRVYAANCDAPAGFERVAPTLEDAYLVTMRHADALATAEGSASARVVKIEREPAAPGART